MAVTTSFTANAYSCVLARLSMSAGDLADLLDRDLAVDVGWERAASRIHRLFYSPVDKECFIAVQDLPHGDVIAVLPLDRHEKVAWKIDAHAAARAQTLVESGDGSPSTAMNSISGVEAATDALVFRLVAYQKHTGGRVRAEGLGKWPAAPYDRRIELLLQDDRFFTEIQERATAKGLQIDDLDAVYISLGNRGKPTRVSMRSPAANAAGDL